MGNAHLPPSAPSAIVNKICMLFLGQSARPAPRGRQQRVEPHKRTRPARNRVRKAPPMRHCGKQFGGEKDHLRYPITIATTISPKHPFVLVSRLRNVVGCLRGTGLGMAASKLFFVCLLRESGTGIAAGGSDLAPFFLRRGKFLHESWVAQPLVWLLRLSLLNLQ
jgi:hypothetical protein